MIAATIVDSEVFMWLAGVCLVVIAARNAFDLFRGR